MMYRTVACDTWGDPWFAELPADGKLLFVYLLTNGRTTAAGAYEITARQMAFDTGLPVERVTALLTTDLADKVTWWADLRVVWVHNFYRRQRAVSNDKFTIAARRNLEALPAVVGMAVGAYYPELASDSTPIPPAPTGKIDSGIRIPQVSHTDATPIPSPSQGGNETVTVTGEETESEQKEDLTSRSPEPPAPDATASDRPPVLTLAKKQATGTPGPTKHQIAAFNALWAKYPARKGSKGSKQEALAAFVQIAESDWPELALALQNYITICAPPDGRYPKDACRWLSKDYWRNALEMEPEPEALPAPQKGASTHATPKRSAEREADNVAAIRAARVARSRPAPADRGADDSPPEWGGGFAVIDSPSLPSAHARRGYLAG